MNRREVRRARAMDRLTQRAGVDVTPHALARIDELGFSLVEVLECVMRPEQTYCSHPDYGPGRRTYQRGALAVVLHEQTRTVVTVLLRRQERWEHGRDVVRPQGHEAVAREFQGCLQPGDPDTGDGPCRVISSGLIPRPGERCG